MFYLAFKHLFTRPQQTILTFVAIIIGTAGYVILSGFMLGFQEYMTDRLINNDSHIRISPRDEIITEETFKGVFFDSAFIKWIRPPGGKTDASRLTNAQGWFVRLGADPEVAAFAPQLVRQVIFANGRNSNTANLIGIDVDRQRTVSNIEEYLAEGSLESLALSDVNVVLGRPLLQGLGAQVGDTISVIGPTGSQMPARIVGTYSSGARQVDGSTAYATISGVQRFTGAGGEISEIVVRLRQIDGAAQVANQWSEFTTDKVESWDQANEGVMTIFQSQDIMRSSITSIIVLIVAFGIYNILNMVVTNKKRDIAILRSIGYSRRDIAVLFLLQGSLLGLVGSVIGLVLGYMICTQLARIEIGNPGGRTSLNISYNILIYVYGFLFTMTASVLASWLPARVASRLAPIEIIRGDI